jgi:hypothetical protein
MLSISNPIFQGKAEHVNEGRDIHGVDDEEAGQAV